MGVRNDFSTAKSNETEKNWPQILAVFIGGLAALNNGLLFAWGSPFLLKITQNSDIYDITEEQGSYFNTIQPFSLMIFSPIFATLTDIIGRKRTLLLIVIPQVASWLLAGFAKSVYVFYAARVFAGMADACLFATLPAYIGEICNPEVRGKWGNVIPNGMYAGELLINVVGSYFGVTDTTYICLPIPILFLILFWQMPESPYFFIMKGEFEKAKTSLKFFKRLKDIEPIFVELKADVERQISESGTWSDLIKIASNRKALLAGLFLRISQQLSGFSVFLTYTQFIFQKSGGNLSHEVLSIVYLAISLVLNVFALIFIVPRFNRLTCYISSSFLCSIVLILMATYIFIDDNLTVDVTSINWIPATCLVLYQVFASYGLSLIPTLMLSELYSASIKSKAMTILVISFGLGVFVNNTIFYYLNVLFGFYSPFYFFGFCALLSGILSYYIIPETRGKTLEEIQQMLKNKRKM